MNDKVKEKMDGVFRLKKVEHDPIEDISADKLMENVRKSAMSKGLIISTLFHIVFVTLLSLGFIKLCIEYKSMDPRAIIKREEVAKEEALKQQKKEEAKQAVIEQAKADAALKLSSSVEKTVDVEGETDEENPVPSVLKNINEISDERPIRSSLDSLDDDLE